MHTITLSNFEVKILDEDEKERALQIVRDTTRQKVKKMQFLPIPSARGMADGEQFFYTSQTFETEIEKLPLEVNLQITPHYLSLMDKLIEIDSDFYEYYYLKGKILLFALQPREDFIIKNRDKLKDDPGLNEFKENVINSYQKIRNDFRKTVSFFKKFRESYENIVDFYLTNIESELAMSYKREAFFRARSSPNSNPGVEYDIVNDMLIPARASVNINQRLLRENLFLNDGEAAKVLFNLANVMKLFMSESADEFKKGLEYCKEAKKILGPLPEVEEAIGYYKEVLLRKYKVNVD